MENRVIEYHGKLSIEKQENIEKRKAALKKKGVKAEFLFFTF